MSSVELLSEMGSHFHSTIELQRRRWLKPISQTAFAASSRSMIVNPSNGFVVDVQPVCHFLHRWSITIFCQNCFCDKKENTKRFEKIFSVIFFVSLDLVCFYFFSFSLVRWMAPGENCTPALLNLI